MLTLQSVVFVSECAWLNIVCIQLQHFIVSENVMVMMMAAFLSLLALSLLTVSADYVGHSVVGEVEQGNYTYYTLKQPGYLQLSLTSDQGDADLYVSAAEIERPTYNFEEHDLSSASCGEDTVHITPSFTRNCSCQTCDAASLC